MAIVRRRVARWIIGVSLVGLMIQFLVKMLNVLPDASGQAKQITLLVWFWPPDKQLEKNTCQLRFDIQGCQLTADRSKFASIDGVLFHHRDIAKDLSNLPTLTRPLTQKWVWMQFDSPESSTRLPALDDLFNITMSYKEGADIVVQRFLFLRSEETQDKFHRPAKTKSICSAGYNPQGKSDKWQQYYSKLKEHIFIEDLKEQSTEYPEVYSASMTKCKFYLLFQKNDDANVRNVEYLSEILHNSLRWGTVPVVSGPSKKFYEKLIPRGAFVHVSDFPDPKELADYLHRLDRNDHYFRQLTLWHNDFMVKDFVFPLEHACLACSYIRETSGTQVFSSLGDWFWGKDKQQPGRGG